jgi:hypothetical protein
MNEKTMALALHYIGEIQSWIEAEYAAEEWEEIRKERENDGKYQDNN